MISNHEIAKRALALRDTAVYVPYVEVGMKGADGDADWSPKQHYCHDNVDAWVFRSPQHRAVRGYFIFDFRSLGFWKVQAHSVVQLGDGRLIDITPNDASRPYPFLPHVGDAEEFVEMAKVGTIDIPVSEVI